jgi:cellulose biosynthesis protein BcsQ
LERACDIQDLCLAAGMDPNHYLTFAMAEAPDDFEPIFAYPKAPEQVLSDPPRVVAQASHPAPEVMAQPTHRMPPIDFRGRPLVETSPMHVVNAPVTYAYAMPSAAPAAPAVDANAVWRSTEPAGRAEPVIAVPKRRAKPRLTTGVRNQGVAFRAAAGGCGATTIAATVARMLAARGEHIIVADGSSLPMLPAHFGATHLSRGTWSLLPGRRRDGGAIHILSNADPSNGASLSQGWLGQEMETFPHPWNRLLLDVSASATTELEGSEGKSLMVIIVVHAGPAARVRIPLLLDEYAEQGIQPFVLLNRFNADKPAHIAMREELRKRLGTALLPFEIRTSQEVPEALDEGVTVDENAPDAQVTADFRQLTDWVQANAGPLPNYAVSAHQGDVQ